MPESSRPKRAVLTYLRASGLVGIVFGLGAAILSSALFWWGVALFYGASVIWLIDLAMEPELSKLAKTVFGFFIFGFGLLLTFGVVAFPAPLNLSSNWNPAGVAIAGIDWKPGMGALVAYISNPTERDYSDLDISLWVHEGIVTVKQGTDIPCEPVSENVITGAAGWNRMFLTGPQRFRCDKLPKHAMIQFVLALVNPTEVRAQAGPVPESLYGPKQKPTQFGVIATYSVTFRPHTVSTLVKIN